MKTVKYVRVRVSTEMARAVADAARSLGISRSRFMQMAVEYRLQRIEKGDLPKGKVGK